MSKRVNIRLVGKPGKLNEETRHAINSLDAACFPSDVLYEKNDCYWWIAYVNEEPAGFAGLRPQADNIGFLCRAGVQRKFAGMALQRKLIEARIRHARKAGLRGLTTYVMQYNWNSLANLVRCGFIISRMDAGYVTLDLKI